MSANGYLQLALYLGVLLALAKPLGTYMARIYEGKPAILNTVRRAARAADLSRMRSRSGKRDALDAVCARHAGVQPAGWTSGLRPATPASLFAVEPAGFSAVSPDSSFNTATSFVTNTNWQGYGGESTMSYLTQMAALSVQNFVSAATGMAVLLPLIRGFARQKVDTLGNFWVDLTRTTLYILLPLSLIFALVLVSQGVVQTFSAYQTVPLVESVEYDNPKLDAAGQSVKDAKGNPVTEKATQKEQVIAVGPAASQIAIKQLGTNGGGFFNVNSAHPFENPTPLSNFLEVLAILLIPAALCYMFGKMVGDTRQGWAILAAMTVVFVVLLAVCVGAEQAGNPALATLGVDQTPSALQSGANMEGKETRFGIVNSALWATATTAASNGSVNAMHDSFTPIGGLVPMWLIQLGEVIFGGVGSGLYGMLIFAIVAVFVAGLDDRAHARVSGQEDRSVRDEDGRHCGADPSGNGAWRDGPRRLSTPVRRVLPTPARTDSPRSSTPSPRPATTTAAPSPACPRIRPSTTRPWASPCCSRAIGSPSRCWPSPARWWRRRRYP